MFFIFLLTTSLVMILQTGSGSTIYYTQDNSNQHTVRSMSFHTSTLHPLSFEDIRKLLNEFITLESMKLMSMKPEIEIFKFNV